MRTSMLKNHHLRGCMFVVCLCLCVILFGSVASAAQYTMEVSNAYKIDNTYGAVRFGTAGELWDYAGTTTREYVGNVLIVPSAFKLKKDGTVVASELYSLELVDALTVANTIEKTDYGSVEYTGNQVVWDKSKGVYKADKWRGIANTDWYYSHKSDYKVHYQEILQESTEARCNFTFQLSDNSFVTLQGKLTMEGKCGSDDCHMLIGVASMDVKVAHTVTLEQDSPTVDGTASVKVAQGEAMPDVTIPQKKDCIFHGYFSEAGGKGTQYYDAKGKAYGQTTWDKDEDGTLYAYWTHEHIWEFSAKGDTLYACCTNTEYADTCKYQEGHELTLKILVNSKKYDGKPIEAKLDGTDVWYEVFEYVPEIMFFTRDEATGRLTNLLLTTAFAEEWLEEAPSEVGKYTAKVFFDGAVATKDFEITGAPESSVPKTGDNTMIGLLALLLTASSLTAVLLVKKSRKKG